MATFAPKRTLLTIPIILIAACSGANLESSGSLKRLPADAVGVISVTPMQFPIDSDVDRTTVFVFDDEGNKVGETKGGAILNSEVRRSRNGAIAVNSESVIILTNEKRVDIGIDEQINEAVIQDGEGKRFVFWFNSGRIGNSYTSRYVDILEGEPANVGAMSGMILASAICGGDLFAITEDVSKLTWGGQTGRKLYRIPRGGDMEIIGEWSTPAGYRPVSREAICSDSGNTLFALYTSREAGGSPEKSPLILVEISLSDGSMRELRKFETGTAWRIPSAAIEMSEGRLYWATVAGEIYSASTDGSSSLKLEWKVPASGKIVDISVTDGRVSVMKYPESPVISEFDLKTGELVRGPIGLDWLGPIIDSPTESRQSVRSVSSARFLN